MEDSIDWLMTSGWFVLHVGAIGEILIMLVLFGLIIGFATGLW